MAEREGFGRPLLRARAIRGSCGKLVRIEYAVRKPQTVIRDPAEERFVSIDMGALARVPIVVYTYRGDGIRIISARLAAAHERAEYEAELP